MKIYHNPKCSKSRQTLALVEQNTSEFEVIKYLEDSLKFDDLALLLVKLNAKPIDIVRTKEEIWKENFKGKELKDNEIIQALVDNPKIIERPIVINGTKARIGRPPENVLKIID
jgi:arsenate reductase